MKQVKIGLLAGMIMLLTACGGGGSTSISSNTSSEMKIVSHNANELVPATLQTLTVNFSQSIDLDEVDVMLYELNSKRGQEQIKADISVGLKPLQLQRINDLSPLPVSGLPMSNLTIYDSPVNSGVNLYTPSVKKELPITTTFSSDGKRLDVTIDPMRANSDYEFVVTTKGSNEILAAIPFTLARTQQPKYLAVGSWSANLEYLYDEQSRLSGVIYYRRDFASCDLSEIDDLYVGRTVDENYTISPELTREEVIAAMESVKQNSACITNYTKVVYSEDNISVYSCSARSDSENDLICRGDDGIILTDDDRILEAAPILIAKLNNAGNFESLRLNNIGRVTYDYNATYNASNQIDTIVRAEYDNFTQAIRSTSATTYEYDKNNNVSVVHQGDSNTSYTYDDNSMITRIDHSSGYNASYEVNGTRILKEYLFPDGENLNHYQISYDTFQRPDLIKEFIEYNGNIREGRFQNFVYTDDKTLSHVILLTGSNYELGMLVYE